MRSLREGNEMRVCEEIDGGRWWERKLEVDTWLVLDCDCQSAVVARGWRAAAGGTLQEGEPKSHH